MRRTPGRTRPEKYWYRPPTHRHRPLPAVWPGPGIGRGGHHAGAVIGIGAGIEPHPHLARQQDAVLAGRGAHMGFHPMATRRDHRFIDTVLDPHRSFRLAGQRHGDRFHLGIRLAAEPAPEPGHDDAHTGNGSWKRSAISARTRNGCWQLEWIVISSPRDSIRRSWCGFPWRIGRHPKQILPFADDIGFGKTRPRHRPGRNGGIAILPGSSLNSPRPWKSPLRSTR